MQLARQVYKGTLPSSQVLGIALDTSLDYPVLSKITDEQEKAYEGLVWIKNLHIYCEVAT